MEELKKMKLNKQFRKFIIGLAWLIIILLVLFFVSIALGIYP